MRTRLVLGALAAAATVATAMPASAGHHVDCFGPIAPACGVINKYVFCHTLPRC